MSLRSVGRLLRPDWRKLLLFTVLLGVAAGARIQASVFTDLAPKPRFYDVIRPLPLWEAWVYLVAPLALISLPLQLLGVDVFSGEPRWMLPAANLSYFYVLSCVLVSGLDWLRSVMADARESA